MRGGAAVVLRSKSPPMIRQEIYAMLCCYQAIRTLISHAAADAGIDPRPDLLHPRPRRDPQPHQRLRNPFPPDGLADLAADLAFEITYHAQPGPRAARPPLRAQNQAPRRPVQDPQARRDRPADPADQDRILADARPPLT